MSSDGATPGLGEAASGFLASLSSEERKASQQEVHKFVRWYGRERLISGLTAPEVANYAERLSSSDIDYVKKLELVRAFLVYANKQGWTKNNLATHLKAKKVKDKSPRVAQHRLREAVSLTQEGYANLQAELESLKSRRSDIIDQVRKAAADKDFRENAPLQAAKEEQGHLEGQIKELEEVMKSAMVIDDVGKTSLKVNIGDSVVLQYVDTAEELRYTIVSPKEVDPTRGKISSASPVGKAIIGRQQGEVVEVVTPAGKLSCLIKLIVD